MIEDVETALGANPAEGWGVLVVCLLAGLAIDLLLHPIRRWAGHRGWRILGVIIHALCGVPTTLGVAIGALAVIWLAGLPREFSVSLTRATLIVLFVVPAVVAMRLLTSLVRMALAKDHATVSLVNLIIRIVGALVVLALVLGMIGFPLAPLLTNSPVDDAEPAWSPDGERIAFARTRDGNSEVFVMLASGAAQTRLTASPGFDGEPSWSPDGAQIAFRSDRGGQPGIYVMDDSGRDMRALSPGLVAERLPAWQPAPDAIIGDQLLFTTGLRVGLRQIALVNTNGAGRRTLVADLERDTLMANWSPDGAWIAFASDRDGTYDIFVAPADGSTAANLTDHPGKDMYPAWSPDGTRIAFESLRDGNWDVFVMNSDGSGLVNLTNHPASDGNPTWSPDGARIAFVSDRGGAFDVYVIDVSGGEPPRQLTADPALDAYPAWSPSGEQIAFRSNRRGNLDIYLLDVATGQSRLFTPNDANDDQPSWSPDGTRIAFVSERSAAQSGVSYDIYLKRVQGGGLVRVTATAEDEQFPRWRPR